jgi:cell division protein FtsQ
VSLDQTTSNVEAFENPAEETFLGAPVRANRSGRRRARRPRRRRRWPYLLLAMVVLGTVWWVGWASSVTLVGHVVVDSPRGISESAVRKASGIAATDHVPAVDSDLVRANILAALPAVETVEVRRRLPDTVRVTVTRRTPFAVIPRGDRYVVIDAYGVEFDEKSSPGKVPVIHALSYEGSQSTRDVLRTLPADLLADVRGVSARSFHDVDLTLANGATVRWGSRDQAELKARVLAGLLSVKARHYDVSAPMMPTTSG